MNEDNFIPINIKDIYNYTSNNFYVVGDTLDNFYEKMLNRFIDNINYFLNNKYTIDLKNYIISTVKKISSLKNENNMFWIEPLLDASNSKEKYIDLMNTIGFPLIYHSNEILTSEKNANNSLIYISIIRTLEKILCEKQVSSNSCELKKFCGYSSDICNTEPWQNTLKHTKCPFAILWLNYGLRT